MLLLHWWIDGGLEDGGLTLSAGGGIFEGGRGGVFCCVGRGFSRC